MWCKHEWKVLSDVVTESQAEILCKLGAKNISGGRSLASRTHILTMSCVKCGKIKRYVESV